MCISGPPRCSGIVGRIITWCQSWPIRQLIQFPLGLLWCSILSSFAASGDASEFKLHSTLFKSQSEQNTQMIHWYQQLNSVYVWAFKTCTLQGSKIIYCTKKKDISSAPVLLKLKYQCTASLLFCIKSFACRSLAVYDSSFFYSHSCHSQLSTCPMCVVSLILYQCIMHSQNSQCYLFLTLDHCA